MDFCKGFSFIRSGLALAMCRGYPEKYLNGRYYLSRLWRKWNKPNLNYFVDWGISEHEQAGSVSQSRSRRRYGSVGGGIRARLDVQHQRSEKCIRPDPPVFTRSRVTQLVFYFLYEVWSSEGLFSPLKTVGRHLTLWDQLVSNKNCGIFPNLDTLNFIFYKLQVD